MKTYKEIRESPLFRDVSLEKTLGGNGLVGKGLCVALFKIEDVDPESPYYRYVDTVDLNEIDITKLKMRNNRFQPELIIKNNIYDLELFAHAYSPDAKIYEMEEEIVLCIHYGSSFVIIAGMDSGDEDEEKPRVFTKEKGYHPFDWEKVAEIFIPSGSLKVFYKAKLVSQMDNKWHYFMERKLTVFCCVEFEKTLGGALTIPYWNRNPRPWIQDTEECGCDAVNIPSFRLYYCPFCGAEVELTCVAKTKQEKRCKEVTRTECSYEEVPYVEDEEGSA